VGTLSANVSKPPENHAVFQMAPAGLTQINLTTTVSGSEAGTALRCGLFAAPWSTMSTRSAKT